MDDFINMIPKFVAVMSAVAAATATTIGIIRQLSYISRLNTKIKLLEKLHRDETVPLNIRDLLEEDIRVAKARRFGALQSDPSRALWWGIPVMATIVVILSLQIANPLPFEKEMLRVISLLLMFAFYPFFSTMKSLSQWAGWVNVYLNEEDSLVLGGVDPTAIRQQVEKKTYRRAITATILGFPIVFLFFVGTSSDAGERLDLYWGTIVVGGILAFLFIKFVLLPIFGDLAVNGFSSSSKKSNISISTAP